MGRKHTYTQEKTQEVVSAICRRLENGEALRNILREPDYPGSKTFYKWLEESEDLRKQYARAKELWADKMFDDIVLIADGTSEDVYLDEDGNEQVNHNIIQRDRLRIDARKWALSKLNPKKYGDRVEVDQKSTNINLELSDTERLEILRSLEKEL